MNERLAKLYAKWKQVSPWILLGCFVIIFLPSGWVYPWILAATMIISFPAIISVLNQNRREISKQTYDAGYKAGLKDKADE